MGAVAPANGISAPVGIPPSSGAKAVVRPIEVAVMAPAEKFPEASLATIVEAVFKFVASVAIVTAELPSKEVPVKCVPIVRALVVEALIVIADAPVKF